MSALPPAAASKKWVPTYLSKESMVTATPRIGTNMSWIMKAASVHQTNMLSLPQVTPGALMWIIVVRKFTPPTIDEKPMRSTVKV